MTAESSPNSPPALLGGAPVRPQGPPDWPILDPEVAAALESAYRDGSWGRYHGAYVGLLQEWLAQYHGLPHVLACGSGTFAVELALRALKIGPGDEVILSAYDYSGNFLCVHAVGATPVLVDVAPENWNLDPQGLPEALGPATRAVIASHLHGGLVPMREVMALAQARGLKVIEDAAQAPGADVQGRKAGTWGDVAVLSFGGSKLLTAGRGGALLTRHADIYQRARTFLQRGNVLCPLSELQAAVLLPQLNKLDECNLRRAAQVGRLQDELRDVAGLRPFRNGSIAGSPCFYKLGWQFASEHFGGLSRDRFVAAARAEGIAFDEGFRALHVERSPSRFRAVGDLTEAARAHRGAVVLHHPILLGADADVDDVIAAVRKIAVHAEMLRTAIV